MIFIGGVPLSQLKYENIRTFSQQALDIISRELPYTQHIAMPIHGNMYGLDEIESSLAQFAGIQDAMIAKPLSNSIKKISLVDTSHDRVRRIRQIFHEYLASAKYVKVLDPNGTSYRIVIENAKRHMVKIITGDVINTLSDTPDSIKSAGFESESKPHVFVAMPFKKEMEDVFIFGIQSPVRAAGFLCERIDKESFTGDILNRVKNKIETTTLVIADLTDSNPNVYLEVGYAWGKARPTILLVKAQVLQNHPDRTCVSNCFTKDWIIMT